MKLLPAKIKKSSGFTLIELLVVIAIIGVLATVLFVAIDPAQQLARTRDAGRINSMDQVAKAIQSYFVSNSSTTPTYPTANVTWITTLQNSGELTSNFLTATAPVCAGVGVLTYFQSGFCYGTYTSGTTTNAIAYVRLESKAQIGKCVGGTPATNTAYFVWSSVDQKAGTVCGTATAASAGTEGTGIGANEPVPPSAAGAIVFTP